MPLVSSAVTMIMPLADVLDAGTLPLSSDPFDILPNGVSGFSFGFEEAEELACEADLCRPLSLS